MTQLIALVTGATEGIGRATAIALGQAGYAVGVTARTAAKVTALEAELTGLGITATGFPADVSSPEQVRAMLDHVSARLGAPDVLVNNAGIAIAKPFADMTLEEWDRTFATNVRSLYLVTHGVLSAMRQRGRGDIVNIASIAGKNGVQNAAAYSASKHAVMGFSRSLMLEVRKEGIRVISICPGSVDTPLMRNSPQFSPNWERILKPEDVAATIVAALAMPVRAMVNEIEIRPANP